MRWLPVVYVPIVCALLGGCRQTGAVSPAKVPLLTQPTSALVPLPTAMPLATIDSAFSPSQALAGTAAPTVVRDEMELIEVEYWGFDGLEHRGQIVVSRALAPEVSAIFAEIKAARFPIEKVVPVSRYSGLDALSMADNNSSGFNYREATGTRRLSMHALGRAIDINPLQNPYVSPRQVAPTGAFYDVEARGTLDAESAPVRAFERRGWKWGGRWQKLKDWQHFEKPE